MCLKSPLLHHSPSYYRPSFLLPSGSQNSWSLIVCVQCKHWAHRSTELPCGERRTNCLCAMVPIRGVCLLRTDPQSVDSRCHLSGLWVLWSPLPSEGQGSLDSKCLPCRCVYTGNLQRCGMVHSSNVCEVLLPQHVSYSWALLLSCPSTH